MDLRDVLGIEYPIMQGGMANISSGAMAAAVSNAGGLGIIGSGGMNAEQLQQHIRTAKSLTDKPFGVNIMLMHDQAAACSEMVISEGVSVVTTGAGLQGGFMKRWQEAGIKVFPVVASTTQARREERNGADGVIAEGTESGGHVGELTTMVLVSQVASAVNIPVIAAGGISNGKQMLAAFALGACGVQVGTAFLLAEECPIHENYKQAIIKAKDIDSVVTGRIGGVPVRILRNQMTRAYLEREKQGASIEELELFTLGALRRAVLEGDVKNGSLMAGQVAGALSEIRPAGEILRQIYSEYEQRKQELLQA